MNATRPSISVVVADDHAVVRAGLRALLEAQPDITVVGEAADGRAAVQKVLATKPTLAVIDVSMPVMNGIEAARRIHARAPSTHVLALSMHADRHYAIGMLRAGARGYVLKEAAAAELVAAVREVVRGGIYVSPELTSIVIDVLVEQEGMISPLATLTPRESQVLQLISEGHTTKGIALKLDVSLKTVESHRLHLMHKLQVETVSALTKLALRQGLTQA